jgi:hypothetical protein
MSAIEAGPFACIPGSHKGAQRPGRLMTYVITTSHNQLPSTRGPRETVLDLV